MKTRSQTMKPKPLTDADAKALGWRDLDELADYATNLLNVDDATTREAMRSAPDSWRRSIHLRKCQLGG